MSRMWARLALIPAMSEGSSRSSTTRPPSGKSSKTCADVYWSTPITCSPRACIAAKSFLFLVLSPLEAPRPPPAREGAIAQPDRQHPQRSGDREAEPRLHEREERGREVDQHAAVIRPPHARDRLGAHAGAHQAIPYDRHEKRG